MNQPRITQCVFQGHISLYIIEAACWCWDEPPVTEAQFCTKKKKIGHHVRGVFILSQCSSAFMLISTGNTQNKLPHPQHPAVLLTFFPFSVLLKCKFKKKLASFVPPWTWLVERGKGQYMRRGRGIYFILFFKRPSGKVKLVRGLTDLQVLHPPLIELRCPFLSVAESVSLSLLIFQPLLPA